MVEVIKRYRNCTLWASYTEQPTGGCVPAFTITDPETTEEQLDQFLWQPAIWLSGKTLEDCRERVQAKGHGFIMCQMIWAS